MSNLPKVLFVCKNRSYGTSSGLFNSASFVAEMLRAHSIESQVVSVIDANYIDREVYTFKPTHVFIEAIWVLASKITELQARYPKIKWIVRVHSKTSFLSYEGVAMQRIKEYAALPDYGEKVFIAPNSDKFQYDLKASLGLETVLLENYYPLKECIEIQSHKKDDKVINIGCFGAVRPFKNQLLQAVAAMAYANEHHKKLRFHMNVGRIEHGNENLKNIIALFQGTKHELVEHSWLSHEDFMKLVMQMDIGLQVSLSESFNIVAADFVAARVPIVGSKEIEWLNSLFMADPGSAENIKNQIGRVFCMNSVGLSRLNRKGLHEYNERSEKEWLSFVRA